MNKKLLVMAGLAAMIALAGCGKREEAVATVGKGRITISQYRDALMQRFRTEDNVRRKSPKEREQVLREMAINEAKYQEALDRKIDQRPELKDELENAAKRKALDLLYQQEVAEKIVSEQTVKDFYDKSGEEIKARHILLRTTPIDTAKAVDTVRVKARIDSIKGAIEKGLDFKTAAKMFSEDASSVADSGNLDWFQWGRMVDEFQGPVWKGKKGEMIGPVRTQYGYHLVVIEDRRKVENRPPFDQDKERIKAQMREMMGEKMNETAQNYLKDLRKKHDLNYDEDALAMFRGRVNDPTVTKTESLDPVFTDEQKQKVAATYDDGKVTVKDLIEKIGNNAHRVSWSDPESTHDLVHAIVEPKLLEAEAAKSGLLKKAQNDQGVIEQKKQAMIRVLEKEEVTDKVAPTEQDERAWYQNHLESYILPEQRLVREIFLKEDSVKAVQIRNKALKGENFTKLAQKYNEKESTKADTGRIGPFEQKRFGLTGPAIFALAKPGDVSDVVKSGKNYSVIKLLDIIPSRTKSFEEARAQASRELRQAKTEEAQKALEAMVLNKFKFAIKEDAVARAFPDNPQAAKPDSAKKG